MLSYLISLLRKYPCALLLILVYFFFIPRSVSYQNAWVLPEEYPFKIEALKEGGSASWGDLRKALNWKIFEAGYPRSTRPLSAYFDILDTKFRSWLWKYILPHPSLSLTWIFSILLSPVFLFLLLRRMGVDINVALAAVSFYLVTPAIMSSFSMFFRPAKPLTNFFIIFFLWCAAELKETYIRKSLDIPISRFLFFWISVVLFIYCDETMLLIFPAIFVFFPEVIKGRAFFYWISIPTLTWIGYFKFIPFLSKIAGYPFPSFDQCSLLQKFQSGSTIGYSVKNFLVNSENLILETMGFLFPDILQAPIEIKILASISFLAWLIILTYLFRMNPKVDIEVIFLIGLVLFFNYLVSIVNRVWGPFYYGSYWSIFFVIYLARLISRSEMPRSLLAGCFSIILINMFLSFSATNLVYKKYHNYPWRPGKISAYFEGKKSRFDSANRLPFSGDELKEKIRVFWLEEERANKLVFKLPKELFWLPVELMPQKNEFRRFDLKSKSNFLRYHPK